MGNLLPMNNVSKLGEMRLLHSFQFTPFPSQNRGKFGCELNTFTEVFG